MQINYYRNIYLYLASLMTVGMIIYVYINWYQLITISQHWQRIFHSSLTTFLLNVKSDPVNTGIMLIGLSFLYGILHSAGPGHGKMIIATYLATQPSQLKKSLRLTVLSALFQGIVAISLVSILIIVLNLSPKKVYLSEYWLQLISYIIMIVIGVFICYRTIKKIVKNNTTNKLVIDSIRPIPLNFKMIYPKPVSSYQSDLSKCSCCNHRHLPTTQELTKSTHWYTDFAIIISIGLRPCSGALLVLLFAYVIGVYRWGIVATFAMSLGTAITTSFIALLVYYARHLAKRLINYRNTKDYQLLKLISSLIAVFGGILFIILGIILLFSMNVGDTQSLNPIIG